MTNKLTRMYSSGISKQMLDQIKKSTLEKFNVCELEKIFCNKQDFIIKAVITHILTTLVPLIVLNH